MSNAEIAAARVGTTLRDKWHLDRLLGVGGMAAVYSATHRNGTRAAVKVLHSELSTQELMRERFRREGHLANLVAHPNTVKVLDDDESEDGSVFLVMTLLEGESVEQRSARAPLSMTEVLWIGDQVLDVLIAAHARGITHRDLKPDNLFLMGDGSVRVLDFGIAKELSAGHGPNDTEIGTSMGTPAFMPPEQARGRWDQVDGRSDLWALGATMFTLLSGRCVHRGETTNETLLAAMVNAAPSLATALPEAPPSLIALIDRALETDIEKRWPDAQTMQRALRAVVAGLTEQRPTAVHPAPLTKGSQMKNTIVGSAFALDFPEMPAALSPHFDPSAAPSSSLLIPVTYAPLEEDAPLSKVPGLPRQGGVRSMGAFATVVALALGAAVFGMPRLYVAGPEGDQPALAAEQVPETPAPPPPSHDPREATEVAAATVPADLPASRRTTPRRPVSAPVRVAARGAIPASHDDTSPLTPAQTPPTPTPAPTPTPTPPPPSPPTPAPTPTPTPAPTPAPPMIELPATPGPMIPAPPVSPSPDAAVHRATKASPTEAADQTFALTPLQVPPPPAPVPTPTMPPAPAPTPTPAPTPVPPPPPQPPAF